MRRLALALIVLACGSSPAEPAAQTFSGTAKVTDGDSLRVGALEIRLQGIDAPEPDQRCTNAERVEWECGHAATAALRKKAHGRTVTCDAVGQDRYKRTLAHCAVDGEDLGAWLVASGWALAYRRYSERYVDDEARARRAARGLWSGEFTEPWAWRQQRRVERDAEPGLAPAPQADPRCRIKGNVSRNGRIYHVPGSENYERTKIDTAKGERWFCSEREARAAGWRAPR